MATEEWRRAHCTMSLVVTKDQRRKLEAKAQANGKSFSTWATEILLPLIET